MPDDEGLALTRLAETVSLASVRGELPPTLVEIGSYCGRSALYLAAGLARLEPPVALLLSVDHHHGSEENQVGWPHHDPELVDSRTGRMDTLSFFRRAITDAGADDLVVPVVGESALVASHLAIPLALVFIDGGHGQEPAFGDYRAWAPRLAEAGYLAIHDVFPDPRDGGRPPYEVYRKALSGGSFVEEVGLGRGSLRVLRKKRPHVEVSDDGGSPPWAATC